MIGRQWSAEADVVSALVLFSGPVDVSMLALEFIGVHVEQGFDWVISRPIVPKSYVADALVLVAEMDSGREESSDRSGGLRFGQIWIDSVMG